MSRLRGPVCVRCGLRRGSVMLPTGSICTVCRHRLAYHPGICPECLQRRPIAYPSTSSYGVLVCAACAGEDSAFACAECGSEAHPYGARRCARCILRERLTALLTDPSTGTIRVELEPLFRTLVEAERPQTPIWWLMKRSGIGPRLLGKMARGEVPISHDTFRRLPYDKPHKYLRDLLAAVDVIEPYEPLIEGMEPWLAARLAPLPPDQADIIRRYARWKVIRHLIRVAEQGRLTAPTQNAARSRITAAIAMLDHFSRHGATAATATQPLLESYIAARRSFPAHEYAFVGWLRSSGINRGIRIAAPPERVPSVTVDHEERWRQAGRLLNDDTIRPYVRVAGLFMVLFAQPLTRVLRMRTAQVALESDGKVFTTFAEVPIEMPPGVDSLIRGILANGSTGSYTKTGTEWLFPGRNPGRAITGAALRLQLADLGISPIGSRQAAFFQLAGEVPAPVLAELIGVTPQNAAKWAALAARDWTGYIAQRD